MFGWIVVCAAGSPIVAMVAKEGYEELVHALFMRRYTVNRTPRGPIPPGGPVIECREFVEVEG